MRTYPLISLNSTHALENQNKCMHTHMNIHRTATHSNSYTQGKYFGQLLGQTIVQIRIKHASSFYKKQTAAEEYVSQL